MAWRVHRESAVLAGGQCALLMQIAHPAVAAGVAEHTGFPRDAWARLRRTLDTGLTIVFGSTEKARAAAERVNELHARVRGDGYDATDPALLLWVHATLVRTAIHAYETFIRPLTTEERARYYEETKVSARLFGITEAPATLEAFDAYVGRALGECAVGDDARRLARAILHPAPRLVPSPIFFPSDIVTAGLLPEPLREAYGIRFGPARRAAFTAGARVARATVPRLPPLVRYVPHARAAARRVRAAG